MLLCLELKELEAAGLIRREQRPHLPPHTEYSVTEFGLPLQPMMAAMMDWALQNRATIETS